MAVAGDHERRVEQTRFFEHLFAGPKSVVKTDEPLQSGGHRTLNDVPIQHVSNLLGLPKDKFEGFVGLRPAEVTKDVAQKRGLGTDGFIDPVFDPPGDRVEPKHLESARRTAGSVSHRQQVEVELANAVQILSFDLAGFLSRTASGQSTATEVAKALPQPGQTSEARAPPNDGGFDDRSNVAREAEVRRFERAFVDDAKVRAALQITI